MKRARAASTRLASASRRGRVRSESADASAGRPVVAGSAAAAAERRRASPKCVAASVPAPSFRRPEAELIVDLLQIAVRGVLLARESQRTPQRFDGVLRSVECQLAAAGGGTGRGARLAARGRLERGEGLCRPLGLQERAAELVAGQRVVRSQRQLGAELRDRALEPIGPQASVPQRDHPRVVVRAAHGRVLRQRGPQRGGRTVGLAGVAIGAADQDVGLRMGRASTMRANRRAAGSGFLSHRYSVASRNICSGSSAAKPLA